MVSRLKWDEEGQKRKLPQEMYQPQLGVVMTDNMTIIADPHGVPVFVDARNGPLPVQTKTAFLIQIRTGDAWQILTRGGVVEKTVFTGTIPPLEDDKITAKDSMLVIFLPGVMTTPEQKIEIDKRIKAGAIARKRADGPPPWASKQTGELRKKLKERRGGPPTTGDGTGQGGTKQLRYGIDQTGIRPWVEGPGIPRQEFPNLRAYGDWYELQFGRRPDGYDSIRKQGGSPAAPTSTIDTSRSSGPLEPVGSH